MKLYTAALSPYSAKVRTALREKGIAFEPIELAWRPSGFVHKPAELLRLNPRGQVPVLVDGELALYDSTVILEYLEDRYPAPALYPRDAAARARCRQLEDLGDELLAGPAGDLVNELWKKTNPAERDVARVAAAREAMERAYARLDGVLGGRDWLCGDFGVADVACYLPLSFAAFVGAGPGGGHGPVQAWMARTGARPSVAATAQEMADAVKALAA